MVRRNKIVSYRSASAVLVVCVVAVSLRAIFLTQSETHVEVFPGADSLAKQSDTIHERPTESDTHTKLLQAHTYTSDGLVIVNPNGSHPIFELMRDAEVAWGEKLARASKTLDEAIVEYKRRYKRAPPLGFDKWWDYVVKHSVQLPDEYDEIYQDLQPFWGIDPADLALAQKELETRPGIVTVSKTLPNTHLEIVNTTLPVDRQAQLQRTIENILDLVRDVQHELPPLLVSFSPYDNPGMLSDWRIKNMALEAAANGTTLRQSDLPTIKTSGWVQACPPGSPAHMHPPTLPPSSSILKNITSPHKSFIASHRAAMDPCMHPSLLTSHGQFLSHSAGPFPQSTLVPRFSLCSTLLHHDIRPPVPYGWADGSNAETEEDVPWELKVDQRLGWRGSTTGMWASPTSPWPYSHRSRLVSVANSLHGSVSVLPVPENESTPVGEPVDLELRSVNPAWMDIAFTDKPVGCDEDAGTCKLMEGTWDFRRRQGRAEEGEYKFIFDIDGNGWSGRFKRLVTSNALVFKATIYPEWFTSRIAPWVHYVPIQISYTDLHDVIHFFREHDALAAKIAAAGKDWSRRFWRKEDMAAYLYRLLLEYARVSSLDRESMTYNG
ncbi:glycosyl transferase family 90-domain-containing protein [Phlebopus sp. FC_14]|nr:glycosyl transferase family 90-domain-containing protein [Phlebopus sp. FC_14]